MKTKLITAILFLGLALPAFAKIPITGTILQANGSRFTGSVTLTLSQPAKTISTNEMVLSIPYKYMIVNGVLPPAASIVPNDDLLPRTYYWATFRDTTGKIVKVAPYFVTGGAFDIGAAIPTTITTNNISVQDLLGIRSIGITGNLTADGSITAGAGFYGDLHGAVFGNVTSTGTSTFNILNVTTLNGTNINGTHINGPIGDVTPSTGNFSSLQLTPHIGNRSVKTDANGYLVESGVFAFTQIQSIYGGATCTAGPGNSAGAECTTSYNWPVAFSNTSYAPVCTGVDPSSSSGAISSCSISIGSFSTTSITIIVGDNRSSDTCNFAHVSCIGLQP